MQGASLLAALALSLGAWAMGPAEMGASLAEIVALLSPVARYHQALALASLLGGAPPDPGPARAALDETSQTLKVLLETRAFEPDWPKTKVALQDLQGAVLAVCDGLNQPERERLSNLWAALDRVGAEATEEARGLGAEWTFQAAMLAKAVLVAPSPLYLQVPKEIREYLTTATPSWISLEAGTGLATILALSNRALSPDEETLAREAAGTLLAALLDRERREGGGT
ncbi:MAG: hypothetical protein ABID40_00375 [Candidatus Bipolaricaulota bacterium]